GALPGIQSEELRRIGGEELDHAVQRDPACADTELVDHVQPVLETRRAVRDLREVVLAERLLPVPGERAVVGRDDRERVRAQRMPEELLVLLGARRRRVDVLGALEVGPLEERVVNEEVLRAGLAPDVPALLAGARDRIDRLAARHVYDIEGRTGDASELDRAVRRLTLELGGTCERMEVRRGV